MRLPVLVMTMILASCATAPETLVNDDPYAADRPIAWDALLDRPRQPADRRIAYGAGENEFGELWLPEGPGPHPVVAMIHGGCWQASIPGTVLQDYAAADLREHGVAVWNLEYSRIGHEDGAYPGTFQDVAAGIDHLREISGEHDLDLSRLVFTGHSAGGHLALWAAARGRVGADSALHAADPLIPNAVITLAGINDLADFRAHGPGRCGEPGTVDDLLNGSDGADADPAAMLPLGVRQVVVSGEADPIVPPVLGARYALLARSAGDGVETVELARAGHFELIDPVAPAWAEIRTILMQALEARETSG